MKVFSAQRYAGVIGLERDGETEELEVAVLDLPTWEYYQTLVAEQKNKAAKLAALGDDATDEEKADLAGNQMDDLMKQLRLLVPEITSAHLKGFSVGQVIEILNYCVSLSADKLQDNRTPLEKKTASKKRSRRSPSRGKGSRSRQSTAGP